MRYVLIAPTHICLRNITGFGSNIAGTINCCFVSIGPVSVRSIPSCNDIILGLESDSAAASFL